jgi:hypothetical protein
MWPCQCPSWAITAISSKKKKKSKWVRLSNYPEPDLDRRHPGEFWIYHNSLDNADEHEQHLQ